MGELPKPPEIETLRGAKYIKELSGSESSREILRLLTGYSLGVNCPQTHTDAARSERYRN